MKRLIIISLLVATFLLIGFAPITPSEGDVDLMMANNWRVLRELLIDTYKLEHQLTNAVENEENY